MSHWMFLATLYFALMLALDWNTAMGDDFVGLSSVIFLAPASICRAIEEKQ